MIILNKLFQSRVTKDNEEGWRKIERNVKK